MTSLMHPATSSSLDALALREMHKDDVPAVSDLAARIWRKHYVPHIVSQAQIEYMVPRVCSEAAILNALLEKKQRGWLSYSGNTLTGYLMVEAKAPDHWFIDKFYVDPSHQRQGTGSALFHHCLQILQPKTLTLRVNRKNFTAVNFYFRHGFVIYALDTLDIGAGFVMDDFLMKKTL